MAAGHDLEQCLLLRRVELDAELDHVVEEQAEDFVAVRVVTAFRQAVEQPVLPGSNGGR